MASEGDGEGEGVEVDYADDRDADHPRSVDGLELLQLGGCHKKEQLHAGKRAFDGKSGVGISIFVEPLDLHFSHKNGLSLLSDRDPRWFACPPTLLAASSTFAQHASLIVTAQPTDATPLKLGPFHGIHRSTAVRSVHDYSIT